MRDFTSVEMEFIKNNYMSTSDEEIAKTLDRTLSSISSKRKKMGLLRINSPSAYTIEEKKSIINDYNSGMPYKKMAKKHNRSESNIICKLKEWDVFVYQKSMWSSEEITILNEVYSNSSWDEILKLLPNHKKKQILEKASSLGITKSNHYWSKQDLDILTDAYDKKLSVEKIQEMLDYNFSVSAIQSKASKCNLSTRHTWEQWELDYLTEKYPNVPTKEIFDHLSHRTPDTIKNKAGSMGLSCFTNWTAKDDKFIKNNYKDLSDIEMAEILDRTHRSVKWRRNLLGFERDYNDGWGDGQTAIDGTYCLSTGELKITNFLVNNNISYEKEVPYNQIIQDDMTNRRFDWAIRDCHNNLVMVEFFGMITQKKKLSKTLENYKEKTIKKIEDCKNNNIILIDVYETDLTYKLKGLINKFKKYNIIKEEKENN